MIHNVECNFKLREKEFQDLMEIYLRRVYSYTRIEIFREVYVAGSVADFVVFSPYNNGFIRIYELKMYWDKDYKRLKRQIKDYLQVGDVVTVATFGGTPDIELPKEVNIMNVKILNGWLDYTYVTKSSEGKIGYGVSNKPENIDLKKRLMLMQSLRRDWERKRFYADKVCGKIQRKIIRLENKKLFK